MLTEQTGKSDYRRLIVLALILTFGMAVIVAQVVRFQVLMYPTLKDLAEQQRTWEIPLPSTRGYIADVDGYILAMDVVQWNISASPTLVNDPDELAGQLAAILNRPKDELYALLTSKSGWVPIANRVDQETGERILDLHDAGITCEPRPLRVYPEGNLGCHVLGIVNDTGDGFYGVEGYHNQLLKGTVGIESIEQDPSGAKLPLPPNIQSAPKDGASLILTLDRNIQHIVEEELQRALEQYQSKSGTVIIMNPKTGALLAIASYPTCDPNAFAENDLSLLADPAVSSMWEPGSIFKIVTWAAGLDSGTISPGTSIYDSGSIEVGGRVIQNWDRQGYGQVTMTDGLVHSLNTVAAFVSTSMGKDRFYNYLRRFGFGTLTGVDLASEGPGMVKEPGDSTWFPSDLGTNSFGQGIAVTPMQMIAAASAVANGGLLMQPYIVNQYIVTDEDGQGQRLVQVEPMVVRRAISQETAHTLTDMMVQVIEKGATQAQIPGYRVAGKTGTAQIPTPYGYDPVDTIGSFVGWVPADDPQFVVLIKLDRPQASPWGSQTAAPTFRAIAERLLVYMQIPPDDIRLAQP
jgi:cell division protein FtsI (penicillin-binding protein 3)